MTHKRGGSVQEHQAHHSPNPPFDESSVANLERQCSDDPCHADDTCQEDLEEALVYSLLVRIEGDLLNTQEEQQQEQQECFDERIC